MRTCGRAAAGHDGDAGYRKAGNRQAEQNALDLDPRAGTALVWGPSARGEGETCSGPCSRAAGALVVIGMRRSLTAGRWYRPSHAVIRWSRDSDNKVVTIMRNGSVLSDKKAYIVVAIVCPRCKTQQNVHIAVRSTFGQAGGERCSCINCRHHF